MTAQLEPQDNRVSQRFLRQFMKHKPAVVSCVSLLLIVIYVIVGSFVFSREYANDTNIRTRWQPPSAQHPFGTDSVGRDVMARTIYGGQISLSIAVFAVTVMVLVGRDSWAIGGIFWWLDRQPDYAGR